MTKECPQVAVVDYGMGNLFSIERVIRHLGGSVIISSDPATLLSASRMVLPGVGAFGDGIRNLKEKGLVETIRKYVGAGRPLLGICLGMQLLMNESEEFGRHEGLGLVKGIVKRIQGPLPQGPYFKIPHVGWNKICYPVSSGNGKEADGAFSWEKTIFRGLDEGVWVYFVHSYSVVPDDSGVILAETQYGSNSFCSALHQKNLWGCQFHPELSGEVGLQILRNFLC